jgi:hypothetical protein
VAPVALWGAAWWAAHCDRLGALPVAPLHAKLTPGRLAVAGILAAAAAAVLAARFLRDLRRGRGALPTGASAGPPFLALAIAYQTVVKAAVEPLKNPHALTAAIARCAPGTAPVAAYRPSETALGIVNFDLNRQMTPLADPAALAAYAPHPQAPVVIPADSLRRLPADLRRRLTTIYDETLPQGVALRPGRRRTAARSRPRDAGHLD